MKNNHIYLIHINKCGGTSMKRMVVNRDNITIPKNDDIITLKKTSKWKNAIKITITRNPYHRILSLHSMLIRDGVKISLQGVIDIITNDNIKYHLSDIGITINGLDNNCDEYIKRHGLPMTHKHYGVVNEDLSLDVDYVFKLEELNDKWNEFKELTGIQRELVTRNKSNNKNDISSFTEEQIKTINEYFYNDFICFNYEMK